MRSRIPGKSREISYVSLGEGPGAGKCVAYFHLLILRNERSGSHSSRCYFLDDFRVAELLEARLRQLSQFFEELVVHCFEVKA